MAKKQATGGLSLRSKDASAGGGTEGALATITEIGFVDEFTYGGRQKDKPSAALHVVFDIEGFEKPWDQHYSVGPSDKYEVIEDGDGIRGLGKQTGLNKKCPAMLFLTAVEDAAQESGLDIDELLPALDDGGNSVRPLEGRAVRLTNIKAETVGGDMKDYIVIAGFEGDAEPAPSKSKSNGKGSSSSKKSSGDDLEAKTIKAVEELIEEHTSVKKGDLPNLIYQANKKDTDAKAMMQLTFKEAWLADEKRPWTYDRKKGLVRAA